MKRTLREAATLVAAAVLCALVANAVASRERKIVLAGSYPHALEVPQRSEGPAPAPAPDVVQSGHPQQPAQATVSTVAPPATATLPPASTPLAAVARSATAAPAAARAPGGGVTHAVEAAPPPVPVDVSRFKPHPDKPWVEIAYDDVAGLRSAGALVLDARRTSIYEQGHIPSARPFSVWESDIDEKVNKLFTERGDPQEQARPIVIYCSGGDCEDSHMLAQKLWGIQFNNVYVYKDGFPDWQKHGASVRTGGAP